MRYALADTAWGLVLFAATNRGLTRLLLPPMSRRLQPARRSARVENRGSSADPHRIARRHWPDAQYTPNLLPRLQSQIQKFFTGQPTEFQVQVDLSGRSEFQQEVLHACRTIPFGQTVTYAQLADLSGHPGAARAVGNAMAGNLIPLVIPCHRVVAANGRLGGFSAPGGSATKKRLLQLEAQTTHPSKQLVLS